MTKFKSILIAIMMLSLSACASHFVPIVTMQDRTSIGLQPSPPLALQAMHFQVVNLNGKLVVVLSMDEYQKLSVNMEDIQAKLNEYQKIIEEMQKYYSLNNEVKK
jgi:starvation-inducible outer membrane lipoprotein